MGEGQVDLGITGYDQVQEYEAGVRGNCIWRKSGAEADPEDGKPRGCETVMDLGFGACKLQVQVPVKGGYASGEDLIGKNIGTSFVHLTEEYFAKLEGNQDGAQANADGARKLKTKIIELSGSVEAACALGVADGIVDLVGKLDDTCPSCCAHQAISRRHAIFVYYCTNKSTTESGETMKAAGLKAIDTVVESSSILIKSKAPAHPEILELIASRIRGVITAQKFVLCQYNVPRSHLHEATAITPGKRAATVTQLDEEGWVAVSSMVEKKRIAPAMDELTKVGATDILVLDIHNSRVN